jgi:hypothetical protein
MSKKPEKAHLNGYKLPQWVCVAIGKFILMDYHIIYTQSILPIPHTNALSPQKLSPVQF